MRRSNLTCAVYVYFDTFKIKDRSSEDDSGLQADLLRVIEHEAELVMCFLQEAKNIEHEIQLTWGHDDWRETLLAACPACQCEEHLILFSYPCMVRPVA